MHIPQKSDYAYHKNVALEQQCKSLQRKIEELKSGEALEKERARAEKWRRAYERECAGSEKDASRAVFMLVLRQE